MEENTIDLQELFYLIWKNILLIIGITLLVTVGAYLISKYIIQETYESETTIYLSPLDESGTINYNDIQINQRMVKTYAEIIKSRTVLKEVIEELPEHYKLTEQKLRDGLTVNSVNDTELISIRAEFTNPKIAKDVANKVAEVFMDTVSNYVKVDNLQILDVAQEGEHPVSPNVFLNTIIGFVLGGMISVGIVLLKEFLNRTIRTDKDVERYLDLPVLGSVPYVKKK